MTDETNNPEPFGPDNAPMIVEVLTANPQLRAAVLSGLGLDADTGILRLAQRRIAECESERDDYRSNAEAEARRCDELLAERNRARNETLAALERVEKAESERDRLRAELGNCKAELELAWSDENDPLKAECDELRTKLEAAEAERGRASEMLSAIMRVIKQHDARKRCDNPAGHGADWAEVIAVLSLAERHLARGQSTAARSDSVGGEAADACHKCGGVANVNDGDDSLGPPVCVNCYDAEWVPPQPPAPDSPKLLTLADVDRRIAQLARAASMRAGVDHHSTRRTLERLQEAAEKALSDSEVANGS